MAGTSKKVADSVSVKMMNFAKDVFYGMTNPTTDQVVNKYVKNIEKVTSKQLNKQRVNNLTKNIADEMAERSTHTGYKLGNFLGGGISNSYKDYKAADNAFKAGVSNNRANIVESIKNGHSTIQNGERVLNGKAVAGTAITTSLAGRAITGGGLYRDKDGNINLPGIPFI